MIPTTMALRACSVLLSQYARSLDRHHGGYGAKRDTLRVPLERAAAELNSLADRCKGKIDRDGGRSDPAVLGYLCCYCRGDAQALADLIEYLRRRQEPQAERLRQADPVDRAAVVLAAFGL